MRHPEGTRFLRVKGGLGMKKWCVITGTLVVLLAIALTSCVPVTTVSELEDKVARLEGELADTKAELAQAREQFDALQQECEELQEEYGELQEEYTVLQGTKEMVFGKGVRLFDIQWKTGYWGILEGKVQNISDQPMQTVEIIVVQYNSDGSLNDVHSSMKTDLFPQEVAEWSISSIFLEHGSLYEREIDEILAIYAFGNR